MRLALSQRQLLLWDAACRRHQLNYRKPIIASSLSTTTKCLAASHENNKSSSFLNNNNNNNNNNKPSTLLQMTTCRYSSSSSSPSRFPVVDLRSDTVTSPSRPMLEAALIAPTGDDVMDEDPTIHNLQDYVADICGKEAALFVPTGTMANLTAIMAHCNKRSSEIIVGSNSHISLWEAGNAAGLAGVHTRQIIERSSGSLCPNDIRDAYRTDDDDHCAKTELICMENTHNMLGGAVLDPQKDIDPIVTMVHEELLDNNDNNIKIHIDGARIFNAVVACQKPISQFCQNIDSISICLSKGLGAPLGSVLVGDREFIRLAKRARKRCGGGMRQAGVVAAMGYYALQNNIERLNEDHTRAKRLGSELIRYGFSLPHNNGKVDTNIVFFALPENSNISKNDLIPRLWNEYGIKMGGGYSRGGELFRVCTHMDVDDEGIDRAAEAIVSLCLG